MKVASFSNKKMQRCKREVTTSRVNYDSESVFMYSSIEQRADSSFIICLSLVLLCTFDFFLLVKVKFKMF